MTAARWNEMASQWDRPVGFHLVELDFARVPDTEERRRLNQMPTSLWLSKERVAQLRAAARSTMRSSKEWQAFLASFTGGEPAEDE